MKIAHFPADRIQEIPPQSLCACRAGFQEMNGALQVGEWIIRPTANAEADCWMICCEVCNGVTEKQRSVAIKMALTAAKRAETAVKRAYEARKHAHDQIARANRIAKHARMIGCTAGLPPELHAPADLGPAA